VRDIQDVINLSPALSITYGTTPANNGINMRGIGTTYDRHRRRRQTSQ